MARILVVDDEDSIIELVSYNLKNAGYEVITAADGLAGEKKALAEHPDLIVLDVMLPGRDGLEVCRNVRRVDEDVPILMLTAKKDEIDRILGLEMGADDYLVKPFSPRELVARVKAILRRTKKSAARQGHALMLNDISLDLDKRLVTVAGETVELTSREFDLLELLMRSPGRVFSREKLLQMLWGEEYFGDYRTIDVHIRHLRQKVESDPSRPKSIVTVWGVGYKFGEN
ncbi:response regulator transcription factor [Metallumcola ferriviriculae]|uniref:Stage 0 sporulation protein A homolog n=1 Tax=Metallumcola ferriviriculae TaxID=3039180 RepID=A0AAU0UP38_9FIRM|nr:response regulator transcription factor [Desulfitibacteraceae bacterium MK1]